MVKTFTKLFHSQNSVRAASILLVITLALSNILGMFRDHFLARYIPTADLDVYFAAFRIPDLIFNFLILGAIFSALVPIFAEFKAKDDLNHGWKVVNTVMNMAVMAMGAAAILLYFLMPILTKWVVPDFSADKLAQTVRLSRILMLTPVFFASSYVISGVLNTFKRFVAYSLAPLIYNASIIAGIFILGRSRGIEGVVYFVVLGSLLHLLIQLPTAVKIGFKFQPILDYKDKAVMKIFQLMLPRTIGLGANQILLLIYTSIASSLAAGSISAFNFANNIQTVPTVVFGSSMATAIFPTLTEAASNSDDQQFCGYLNKTIRTISYILIPISLAIILLRAQIIRLVLGSGQFAWNDTTLTAQTLGFFAVSLLPQGLSPLFARAFYAVKDTKTPMYLAVISTVLGVAFAYLMAPKYGVGGLALAFGISSYLNAILLYIQLTKIPNYSPEKDFFPSIVKIVVISLLSAVVMQFSKHYFSRYINMNTFMGVLSQTILVSMLFLLVFLGLSKIAGLRELEWALKRKVS